MKEIVDTKYILIFKLKSLNLKLIFIVKKFEKELASVRLDYDDMETQLQEAVNAKDREVII